MVEGHRGYGIGTAMKARMTLRLVERPRVLRSVTTATAVGNAAMKAVNQSLGYEKTAVRRCTRVTWTVCSEHSVARKRLERGEANCCSVLGTGGRRGEIVGLQSSSR